MNTQSLDSIPGLTAKRLIEIAALQVEATMNGADEEQLETCLGLSLAISVEPHNHERAKRQVALLGQAMFAAFTLREMGCPVRVDFKAA